MYTKQEAIEAINRGERFKNKEFDQVRNDLDVALAFALIHQYPVFRKVYHLWPNMKNYIPQFRGLPKELAETNEEVKGLIVALQDAIKIRDLEASFQSSLTQKSTPKRTTKI